MTWGVGVTMVSTFWQGAGCSGVPVPPNADAVVPRRRHLRGRARGQLDGRHAAGRVPPDMGHPRTVQLAGWTRSVETQFHEELLDCVAPPRCSQMRAGTRSWPRIMSYLGRLRCHRGRSGRLRFQAWRRRQAARCCKYCPQAMLNCRPIFDADQLRGIAGTLYHGDDSRAGEGGTVLRRETLAQANTTRSHGSRPAKGTGGPPPTYDWTEFNKEARSPFCKPIPDAYRQSRTECYPEHREWAAELLRHSPTKRRNDPS